MQNPLLVFRIGWMKKYEGIDDIKGGGSYVKKNREGGEMWNFREEAGRYYGYVMSLKFAGVDLSRIDNTKKWKKGDELNNVDIVYIATNPEAGKGQVAIGWYKDATIFHKEYRKRRGSKKKGDWSNIEYLCEVSAENGTLLKIKDRTFSIPQGKGLPGTSNVWYENTENESVIQFTKELRELISSNKTKKSKKSKKNNTKEILAIERAAVEKTWKLYDDQGYEVTSVEEDNVGWDLEATKNNKTLLIEVKGHKGNVIQFELTPNEYNNMKLEKKSYRVCVVRNALTKPDLTEFLPKEENDSWYLEEVNGSEKVRLDEKVAAKAVQVDF